MRQLIAMLLLAPALAAAQTMEPRAYTNLPIGLNIALAGYLYSEGELAFDASVPLTNATTRAHTLPLGYVRSIDVLGNAGSVALLVPFVQLSATGTLDGTTEARREVSGLGDPALRLAVNYYGAPALDAAEFRDWRQDLIAGASLTVTAPLGQYDSTRLINIGANRWSFKPELGLSQALGLWTVELAAGVTFFTRNDEFFNGNTVSQEPLYSAQVHFTRQLGAGVWGAVSATRYGGGRNTISGVVRNDTVDGTRMAFTLSLPVDGQNSVKLSAVSGLYTRTGSDYNSVGVVWQHLWQGSP